MNSLSKQLRKLPEDPGVYFFWQKGTPIYIGKAKNLKNRVGSYFSQNLIAKTKAMVEEADSLTFIKVESELESLLLEANLIRKNQPKYNSVSKDDKHPLYITITKDEFPRIITTRQTGTYGPFPSSSTVRSVLKMIRRIFPYSDHKIGKRACIYHQIGLCNPCPSTIRSQKEKLLYLKNIRKIRAILSGKFNLVRRELTKEMDSLSRNNSFEEAGAIRDQIARLDYITQPIIPGEYFLENPNLLTEIRKEELNDLKKILIEFIKIEGGLTRIECYDIAHLAGTNPTASMVTFVNGVPDKTLYRHFKIRQLKGADDLSSMKEVAKRRIKYLKAWGAPDLIIVDGGKTQVNAFKSSFNETNIPIIGLAKRFETLIIPAAAGFKEVRLKRGSALKLVQRIRDEAHRFARIYHHHLLKRELLYN